MSDNCRTEKPKIIPILSPFNFDTGKISWELYFYDGFRIFFGSQGILNKQFYYCLKQLK